jgi:hypothetical protein
MKAATVSPISSAPSAMIRRTNSRPGHRSPFGHHVPQARAIRPRQARCQSPKPPRLQAVCRRAPCPDIPRRSTTPPDGSRRLEDCRLALQGTAKGIDAPAFVPGEVKHRTSERGRDRKHRQCVPARQLAYTGLPVFERPARLIRTSRRGVQDHPLGTCRVDGFGREDEDLMASYMLARPANERHAAFHVAAA